MKSARLWILVALLMAQSMAATLNTLPGEDLRSGEWEGPLFETGARSNNSSSGCGYDAAHFYIALWTTPMSVHEGDDVNVTMYTNCNLLNQSMTMTYSIMDASNTTVDNGSWTWTPTMLSDTHYAEATNVSLGTYTIEIDVEANGSHVTSYNTTFTVSAHSCTVSPFSSQSMYNIGDNFTGTIDYFCSYTNESMSLYWTIMNDDTSTVVDSGYHNWTSTNFGGYHSVNSTALASQGEGNFTFEATLSTYNNDTMMWDTMDSGNASFMIYNFSSGGGSSSTPVCGEDASEASVYAYADAYLYDLGENFTGTIYTYCALTNETVMLDWRIENADNNNSTVDSGSFNWTAMQTYEFHNVTSTALAMEAEGNYAFKVDWTWYNTSSMMWEDLGTDTDTFMITNFSSGGNHSSSGSSNTCSAYAWSAQTTYDLGDDFTGSVYTFCNFMNESMLLTWSILNDDTNSTVDSGSFNWTSMTYSENHNVTSSVLALQPEGNYTFEAEISWYNGTSMMWEVLDHDDAMFAIANLSTGGSNHSTTTQCWVYTWSSYYMYYLGDNFSGEIDTYCSLDNETLMLTWTLENAGDNTTVDSGSFNWTSMTYMETHWVNSTALASQPAGDYTFSAELSWYNTSSMMWEVMDSDSSNFMIYNSSGSSGNGTNNTGCGYEASFFYLSGWMNTVSPHAGDTVNLSVYSNCNLLNELMTVGYEVEGDDGSTMTGSWTWTAMHLMDEHFIEVTNASAGTYNVSLTASYGTPAMHLDNYTFDFVVMAASTNGTDNGTDNGTSDDDDMDGYNNTYETACGSDPMDNASIPADFDMDGMCDAVDMDDDNDGVMDVDDAFPLDASESYDADGDGTGDNADMDDDGDGVDDVDDNCPNVANPDQADLDMDGVGSACDEAETSGGTDNGTDNGTGGTDNGTDNGTGGTDNGTDNGTGGTDNGTVTNVLPECDVYVYIDTEVMGSPAEIRDKTAFEAPLSGEVTIPLIPGDYKISLLCTDADGDALTLTVTTNGQTMTATEYDGEFYVEATFEVEDGEDFTETATVEWNDGSAEGELVVTFTTDIASTTDGSEGEDAGGLPGFGAVSGMVAIAIGVAVSGRRKDE